MQKSQLKVLNRIFFCKCTCRDVTRGCVGSLIPIIPELDPSKWHDGWAISLKDHRGGLRKKSQIYPLAWLRGGASKKSMVGGLQPDPSEMKSITRGNNAGLSVFGDTSRTLFRFMEVSEAECLWSGWIDSLSHSSSPSSSPSFPSLSGHRRCLDVDTNSSICSTRS